MTSDKRSTQIFGLTYVNSDLLANSQKQRKTDEVFHNIFDALKKDCAECGLDIKVPNWLKNSSIDVTSKACHPKTTSGFQFTTKTRTPQERL